MTTDFSLPVLFDQLTAGLLDSNGLALTGPGTRVDLTAVSAEWKGSTVGGDLATRANGTGAVEISVPRKRTGSGETLDIELTRNDDESQWLFLGGRLGQTIPNPKQLTDGAFTSGATTFGSQSAAFTSADVGKAVVAAAVPSGTTIVAVPSATSATLSQPATATASNASVSYGFAFTSGYEPPAPGTEGRPNGLYIIGYTEAWLGQGLAPDLTVGNLYCYIWPQVKFVSPGEKLSADLGAVTLNGICYTNGQYVPPTWWQGPSAPFRAFHSRSRAKRANLPQLSQGLNLV